MNDMMRDHDTMVSEGSLELNKRKSKIGEEVDIYALGKKKDSSQRVDYVAKTQKKHAKL